MAFHKHLSRRNSESPFPPLVEGLSVCRVETPASSLKVLRHTISFEGCRFPFLVGNQVTRGARV